MAGASMNDIKARIKSVESTMQITKAMELVATSKLRRAKERAERARPYYEVLSEAVRSIKKSSDISDSVWCREGDSDKTLYVVIAGDRGLAGGYNSNIYRLTEELSGGADSVILPIGKKALEYYRHRKREIFSDKAGCVNDVGVGTAILLCEDICRAFSEGRFKRVVLVYTRFVSMLSQAPVYEQLLPLELDSEEDKKIPEPMIEEEPEELLSKVVPSFAAGILYSAVCESLASESGARRSAMSSANKNAGEMIDTLMLKYNRARQAVITQEITEIVSGAEAL